MKTLLIGLILVAIVAGYLIITQAMPASETQLSTAEIDATLNDAGNSLLDETNDVAIGELM